MPIPVNFWHITYCLPAQLSFISHFRVSRQQQCPSKHAIIKARMAIFASQSVAKNQRNTAGRGQNPARAAHAWFPGNNM
jgi:hypothetical protein